MKRFIFLNTMIVLFADYKMMLLDDIDYLFSYPKVVKGSKIVVYGAEKFGHHIIRALDESIAMEIKRKLWGIGIDKKQIAMMAPLVITEEYIEKTLNVKTG